MNLKLEVLLSTSIKHKKPWPHLHWIGEEKEAVLLSDDHRLSILTLSTGRTQRKIPKLQPLLKNMLSVTTSANGSWLAGLLNTGELFLWKKDGDCLKTVAAVAGVCAVAAVAQESATKLFLFVSRDGKRVLVVSQTGTVFLWESGEKRDLSTVPGSQLSGRWAQVMVDDQAKLPQAEDKDSTIHAIFHTDEMLGDCCFCSFVFTRGEALVLTTLRLKWLEQVELCISAIPFCVQWVTQTHSLGALIPGCVAVKSRGALLAAFSRDGLVLAVIINQNDPKATQVLFVNPLKCVAVSSSLRGCGCNGQPVPVRFLRSYWVGAVSWTHDGLFLACMLKRGALLLMSRLGELVTITTFGCSVEFGPAEYIPLHPLITYRQAQSLLLNVEHTGSAGSSTSESDSMRQRFSLAAHPRLPYLIVSDGYMFTVLRFAENYSAWSVLKTLLLEVTQDLDDVQHLLMNSEAKDVKLQPMSSLRRSVLQGRDTQGPGPWMPPSFLQDETPASGQADEDDDSADATPYLTDYHRFQSSHPSTMEQGHLEFASMFDTLHAKQGEQADHCEAKLRQIQNSLLTAWSMVVSVKGIEGKDLLLQYTVRAFLQFACLLPFAPATLLSSAIKMKNKMVKKALRRSPGIYRTLQLLRYCLTVLNWDGVHKHSLIHAVRLSADIVKLILSQKLGPASFSHSLLSSLLALKLASVHLDTVYSLQPQAFLDLPWEMVSDSVQVLFSPREKGSLFTLLEQPSQTVQTIQQPSHRLAVTWRLLYQHSLQHHSHLRKIQQQPNRGRSRKRLLGEEAILTSLLSQIQTTLQAMGERLGPNRQLKPLAGEECFLLGSYLESVQIWRAALQGEMGRDEGRVIYLQTRYSLAILYTHLYCYDLSAAQTFTEQLVGQMLNQNRPATSTGTDELELDSLLDVGVDAALAVVQSLARFMALYFTNQPLFVLPPHHIDTLPPLHIQPGCQPRVVYLRRCRVSAAVREQHLSATWSVKYTVDLMLSGRLIPEAAWLASSLGDWKTAVVLSLAFNLYNRNLPESVRRHWRSLHLPAHLHPSQIFQDKLQVLLQCPANDVSLEGLRVNSTLTPGNDTKQLTDCIEEDCEVLFGSVQEILKAAVMVDADVLTETFELLMQTAKDLGGSLPGLVPDGLYLPAPPLYCPQLAIDSESVGLDSGLSTEKAARQKVSVILQRLLLLFRAARCSLPAAHWYIDKLLHAQKIMNKIRVKAGLPPLCPFPDSLLCYGKARSGFFRPGAAGDGTSDAISVRVIGSFRDLCGLCWMFHVRERLSESCRKYQAARDNTRSPQDYGVIAEYDAAVVDHCLNSLGWACRMLPFARFMNVEELVQDIILSLVSELPPIRQVAEILVRAFPNVEDVRVPLRDKYQSLQQRVRHSTVRGPDGEEMMSVLLHDLYRQRMKVMKRTVQNIGPTEQHIWERAEERLRDQEDQTYDQFSLGTSLSRSSLTDTRRGQSQGDGDMTDSISEEFQDLSEWRDNIQQLMGTGHRNTASSPQRTSASGNTGKDGGLQAYAPCLPVVGSWEFERDEEEYVKFLELFLCYLLERDRIVNEDPAVPLLTSCSAYLKELELNSLVFQVHTTLKRRQSRTRAAGEVPRTKSSSCLMSEWHRSENLGYGGGSKSPVSSPTPGLFHSTAHSEVLSNEHNIHSYFPAAGTRGRARGRGLFGLRLHSLPSQLNVVQNWAAAPDPACSVKRPVRTDHTPCLSVFALLEEDLTPELEVKFQGTAKLLEWMIRWSERRLLCGLHKVETLLEQSTAIRVKTSMPAILRSLWLLDRDLEAQTLDNCNHRKSERRLTVYQPEQPTLKLDRESSVDTGYPGSLRTPVMDLEADIEGDFIPSDDAEGFQKQDLSHTNLNPRKELTSDSDSGTEEEESADGPGGHSAHKQGHEREGLINTRVYEEEYPEPRPCNLFSPCISISLKPKPRTRIRDKMECSLDVETPQDKCISKEPGEEMSERVSKEPGEEMSEHVCKEPGEEMSERICKEPGEEMSERVCKEPGEEMSERVCKEPGEEMSEPISKEPGEEMSEPISKEPGEEMSERVCKEPGEEMSEPISKEPGEEMSERVCKEPGEEMSERVCKEPGEEMSEPISKEPGKQEMQMDGKETVRLQREAETDDRCSPQTTSQPSMTAAESSGPLPSLAPSSLLQPVLDCQAMPGLPTPAVPVPVTAATQTVDPDGQTVNTPNLFQHMLQDEMFKLVQLQQINFLSLMQVVGSSLTSLPSIQQQLPPIPSQNRVPPTPNVNINPTPTGQVPIPGGKGCEKATMESSLPVQRPSSLPEEKVAQKPEELSLHPPLEGDDVRTLPRISDSQNVRNRDCDTIRPHLLLAPGAQPPATTFQFAPRVNSTPGLPLLRLQPCYELRAPPVTGTKLPRSIPLLQPTPREAWAPGPEPSPRPQLGFPSHLNSSAYDPGALQKAAEEKERKEELLRRGPPKHLNLDQYQQPPASPWTEPPAKGPPYSSERSQREFQPPSSHAGCSQVFRMPLLHLPQPTHMTHFPLMAKQLPNTPANPGQSGISSAPSVQYPRDQQQYCSFCPESQVSVVHPPRLIPAQDLIAFEQGRLCRARQPSGRQQAEAFRLLKVNIEPFEPRTSKKRLKRRHERRTAERAACKPPRSDQQLSPPDPDQQLSPPDPDQQLSPPDPDQQLSSPDLPEPQEVESRVRVEPVDVPPVPKTSGCSALPLGPRAEQLEDQIYPFSTSAELQCFASTMKNAEERKDASTNTEQGPEPHFELPSAAKSYKDAGIVTCSEIKNSQAVTATAVQTTSASVPLVQVVPPDVFMNLRFPSETCQKPLVAPTNQATPDQLVSGHKFLNVIDIDAGELLNSLPVTTSAPELMPSSEREDISIAGLHLMAASVTNAVPPDTCQQQGSPSPSRAQAWSEGWEQQLAGDHLTERLLQQDSAPLSTPPQAAAHSVGTKRVRAQLSEMEHQLSALQDMAVNMEQDFANTKMLINTIEHLNSAMDPEEPVEYSRTWDAGAAFHPPPDPAEERGEDRCYSEMKAAAGPAVCTDWRSHTPPLTATGRAGDRCYPIVKAAAGPAVCTDWRSHTPPLTATGRAGDRCYSEMKAAAGPAVCTDWRSHTPPLTATGRAGDRCYPIVKAAAVSPRFADSRRLSARLTAQKRVEDQGYSKAKHAAGLPVCVDWHRHTTPLAAKEFDQSADRNRLSRETVSSTDDRLHLSGMSGVSDIVAELFNQGKLSTEGLGLSEEQIKKLTRHSKPPKRSEQEQKEIQEWMKRKRRQRLEIYQQHREDLMRKERAPFHPKEKQRKFTSKEIKENQKQNAVKKRVTLAENQEQRTQAALSLMNEMLCDTVQLPNTRPRALGEKPIKSAQLTQNPYSSTPRGRNAGSRSLSASRVERCFSGTYRVKPARSVSSSPGRAPQTGTLRQAAQRRPCPVTGSTYRGLVRHQEARAASCHQASLKPSFRLRTQHPAADESDWECSSLTLWSPPEEIRQILDREDDPFLQGDDLTKADGGADCELSDIESDSTSSILSNLDWNAVNKMVATLKQPEQGITKP
ncbi:ciliogenesis and planar polarity effector 1 [Cetorhinus maximus]